MGADFVFFVAVLCVVETNGAIVEGDQEVFVEGHPDNVGWIDAFGRFLGQINFESRVFVVDIVDGDFGIVFDERIGYRCELFGALGPGHAADGTAVSVSAEAFASLAGPEFGRGVGGGSEEVSGEAVAVEVPNGTLVAVEGAQAVAIFGSPNARDVVFAGSEEQVAVVIVLHARDAALVSFQKNWSLFTLMFELVGGELQRVSGEYLEAIQRATKQTSNNLNFMKN